MDKDYVGKIVKVSGQDRWGHSINATGIVYEQTSPDYADSVVVLSLIKTDGTFGKVRFDVNDDRDVKVTSTQIDPELRSALKEAYKSKVKLDAFEAQRVVQEKALKADLNVKLTAVQQNSNDLTDRQFMDEVEKLFTSHYPSSGEYYRKYFELSSWNSKEICVQQTQDVEKYASPEAYSFLHRYYDNTIHVDYESSEYKRFCQLNAPRIIPELAKNCKTDVCARIGDKNWLTASRTYTFPIKYGYTKKSLEELASRLFGEPMKKPSLDSQIGSASSKTIKQSDTSPKREETIR